MKLKPWFKHAVVATGLAWLSGTAVAQPMVEWVVPAMPSNKPQTAEQAEAGRQRGRELPAPEILQPRLDSALPEFVPRKEKLSGSFKGGSSDVLTRLVVIWFERFRKYHPGVTLSIAPPYAGSLGAIELVKENLDFVFVSRELRPDDLKDFKAKFGYGPLSVPVSGGSFRHFGALDAMAFFVHKDNPLEKISYDQIDAIYSSTQHRGGKAISTWGQLGLAGEWADKPINAWGIRPWNGFEEFIRQRVLSVGDKRGEWRVGVNFEKVVFPMATRVAEDKFAIGYSGLAYLDAAVKVIPVSERAGGPFLAPSYENVAAATYPLSRLTFFNANKAPGKPLPPVLDEFLRFVLSREGQQAVLDHASYIPLRAGQAQASRVLLTE